MHAFNNIMPNIQCDDLLRKLKLSFCTKSFLLHHHITLVMCVIDVDDLRK